MLSTTEYMEMMDRAILRNIVECNVQRDEIQRVLEKIKDATGLTDRDKIVIDFGGIKFQLSNAMLPWRILRIMDMLKSIRLSIS